MPPQVHVHAVENKAIGHGTVRTALNQTAGLSPSIHPGHSHPTSLKMRRRVALSLYLLNNHLSVSCSHLLKHFISGFVHTTYFTLHIVIQFQNCVFSRICFLGFLLLGRDLPLTSALQLIYNIDYRANATGLETCHVHTLQHVLDCRDHPCRVEHWPLATAEMGE